MARTSKIVDLRQSGEIFKEVAYGAKFDAVCFNMLVERFIVNQEQFEELEEMLGEKAKGKILFMNIPVEVGSE